MPFKFLLFICLVLVANAANANDSFLLLLFILNKETLKLITSCAAAMSYKWFRLINYWVVNLYEVVRRRLHPLRQSPDMVAQPVSNQRRQWVGALAGHPQGEGDEEGGQGGAGGYSQTHHGQETQQRRQQDDTPVPDQRFQPLTKLESKETGADNKGNSYYCTS